MIKKLIGIVAAVAVIVIVVMTAIRSGEFRSMLTPGGADAVISESPSVTEPAGRDVPAVSPSIADSVAVNRRDSL